MGKTRSRKRKESGRSADKFIKEENADDQHSPSPANETRTDKENRNEDQSGVERRGEKIVLSRSPERSLEKVLRNQLGGALLLQEAMEVEYPLFIAKSSGCQDHIISPPSSVKECLAKGSSTMLVAASSSEVSSVPMKRCSLRSSAPGKEATVTGSAKKVSTRGGPTISMSTATDDCRMTSDQQFEKGTKSACASEMANDPASPQLTKLRSQQCSPVTQEYTSEVSKEAYQRSSLVAEDRNTEGREDRGAPTLKFDPSSLKPVDLSVFIVNGINLLDFYPSTDQRKFNLDFFNPPPPKPIKLKIYDQQGDLLE